MMQIIKIIGKMPSLNEYIEACRTSAQLGAKMKKEVENIIIWQIGEMQPVTKPVIMHFKWREETRRRDKDNVAAAKKFILDAMQKAGKLPNDDNRYIAGFTDSFEYGGEWGVDVSIETL